MRDWAMVWAVEGELSVPWVREEAVPWVLPAGGWGMGRYWAGYGE